MLGTLVSQTVLNVVALVALGGAMFSTIGLFRGHEAALVLATTAPVVLLLPVLASPALLGHGGRGPLRLVIEPVRHLVREVRSGLHVFLQPRLGAIAVVTQLCAWALQWIACFVLLGALGLGGRAGIGAAAAVLFAVNVTAVLPATPSNLGVFQAACAAVLTAGYGIGTAKALGYGIILQAVEVATAVIMGMPALLAEGLSWRDVRLRALRATPVRLHPRHEPAEVEA